MYKCLLLALRRGDEILLQMTPSESVPVQRTYVRLFAMSLTCLKYTGNWQQEIDNCFVPPVHD